MALIGCGGNSPRLFAARNSRDAGCRLPVILMRRRGEMDGRLVHEDFAIANGNGVLPSRQHPIWRKYCQSLEK
jgi:hypothetical protein